MFDEKTEFKDKEEKIIPLKLATEALGCDNSREACRLPCSCEFKIAIGCWNCELVRELREESPRDDPTFQLRTDVAWFTWALVETTFDLDLNPDGKPWSL